MPSMSNAAASKYPVRADGMERADNRFISLARNVGAVLEQHGYPRVTGEARIELEKRLFEFCYGSRGAAGELERRLNGTAPPLVSDEGALDSYDCAEMAHELRRLHGAEGAIVIAIDPANRVYIGMAVPKEPGSQPDLLAAHLMRRIDEVADVHIQDVVLDLVLNADGTAESLS
jgi:hypothetical protein